MAIKIHEFYKHYRRSALWRVLAIQMLCAFVAMGLGFLLWKSELSIPLVFVLSFVSFGVINAIAAPMIVTITSSPLKTVAQAIAHVSKDPVLTPPPDISRQSYEQSGLRELVQTVYELAAGAPTPVVKNQASDQSALFRAVADNLPAGVIVISGDTIPYANQAAPVSPTPNNGQKIDLTFEQKGDLWQWLTECRQSKVRDTHLWLRVADKLPGEAERRIFDVLGYYQKNDQNGVEAILVTFDRTNVYASDQEDMDFIALAAHELRGPITVIRGYIDVFQQELGAALSDDQRMLLERLQVSSERLSSYVNNILNVSRYDRNQFKTHLAEETVKAIVSDVLPDLALRAKTQNRSVVFTIPDGLPTVAADRSGVGEVITNLVDNAIKYSRDKGQVTVDATPKENFVEITVQDQGIGMPSAIVGNLFTRFYRSHKSRQAIPGTGLGLYICKAIIESHGGTIWVRSVEGQGTTFGFTLPTYASIADKLKNGNNGAMDIVQRQEGWIKNHAMVRQ